MGSLLHILQHTFATLLLIFPYIFFEKGDTKKNTPRGRDDLGHVLDVGDSDRPGRGSKHDPTFHHEDFSAPRWGFLMIEMIEMFNRSIFVDHHMMT